MSERGTTDETDNSSQTIIDKIPGMVSGSTGRNVGVGAVYFFALAVAVAYIELVITVLIVYIGISVATNRHGLADRIEGSGLSKLPGLGRSGTIAGVAAIGYLLIGTMVFAAIAGVGGDDVEDAGESIDDADEEASITEEVEDDSESEDIDESEPSDETSSDEQLAEQDDSEAQAETDDADEADAGEAESEVDEAEVDVEETASEDSDTQEILSEEDMEFVFQTTVEGEGYDLQYAEHEGHEFTVEYNSYAVTAEDRAGEIGYFAGAYGVVVDEGHGDNAMRVFGNDAQGVVTFSYFVESEWAQAHHDGEMSDEEYFENILDTYQEY